CELTVSAVAELFVQVWLAPRITPVALMVTAAPVLTVIPVLLLIVSVLLPPMETVPTLAEKVRLLTVKSAPNVVARVPGELAAKVTSVIEVGRPPGLTVPPASVVQLE